MQFSCPLFAFLPGLSNRRARLCGVETDLLVVRYGPGCESVLGAVMKSGIWNQSLQDSGEKLRALSCKCATFTQNHYRAKASLSQLQSGQTDRQFTGSIPCQHFLQLRQGLSSWSSCFCSLSLSLSLCHKSDIRLHQFNQCSLNYAWKTTEILMWHVGLKSGHELNRWGHNFYILSIVSTKVHVPIKYHIKKGYVLNQV